MVWYELGVWCIRGAGLSHEAQGNFRYDFFNFFFLEENDLWQRQRTGANGFSGCSRG
jgi:hypothetical protein